MIRLPFRSEPALDAFVLAGGASSRMGTDKALLRFQGITLIERTLQLLRSLGLVPRIVGSRDDLHAYAPVIPDRRVRCGPLSGIEAGLLASAHEAALFVPIDIPLLPAVLLQSLVNRSENTQAPATVPRILGQPQPLVAIYRRELLPTISASLAQGDYKVLRVMQRAAAILNRDIDLFNAESVSTAAGYFVGWPAVPSHAFLNCNTPADIKQAETLATASHQRRS